MANILLVEPEYRSKFPPLGLMRLSTYHKRLGDKVTFVRGRDAAIQSAIWDRIYISSLFTYELPKTAETAAFYRGSVECTQDLILGGTAVTLLPDYVRSRVDCRVIKGLLDKPGILSEDSPEIDTLLPDYSLLEAGYEYRPTDSYFCRVTKGCIRRCNFCAVPVLEPKFGYRQSVLDQLAEVDQEYGPRQNLVLMDNNVLANRRFDKIVDDIAEAGFARGATRNGHPRTVDFNQGIDARLITNRTAALLARLALAPVRLAFDTLDVEKSYVAAIERLANVGFTDFTNYVMFNCEDDPASFYHRLRMNADLSEELGVRITGFPMKFVPINDITRANVGKHWKWRYLRGIQCVLLATHGVVSPKLRFFKAAFGDSVDEFLEIVSMPDRYIIYRETHKEDEAREWRREFRALSASERNEFLDLLDDVRKTRRKREMGSANPRFRGLLAHYYPNDFDPEQDWFEQEALNLGSQGEA